MVSYQQPLTTYVRHEIYYNLRVSALMLASVSLTLLTSVLRVVEANSKLDLSFSVSANDYSLHRLHYFVTSLHDTSDRMNSGQCIL